MKTKLVIISSLAVGITAWVLLIGRPATLIYPNDANAGMDMLRMRSDSGDGVDIEATPLDLSSTEWSFGISLSTHTVSLDQDLSQSARIISDDGKISRPLRWEGDPEGGHHRSGTLYFEALSPRPQSIRLEISGIGKKRSYFWELRS